MWRWYKLEREPWERGSKICKRKHCSSLNHICNYFQSINTRTYLLGLCRWPIYSEKSSPFLFDYPLNFILTVVLFIRIYFSTLFSTNSLYWAWIQSYIEPKIQTRPYRRDWKLSCSILICDACIINSLHECESHFKMFFFSFFFLKTDMIFSW